MDCICGSGLPQNPNWDARGIFLCHTCVECYDKKMSKYRRDVLTDSDYWHDEPIEESE